VRGVVGRELHEETEDRKFVLDLLALLELFNLLLAVSLLGLATLDLLRETIDFLRKGRQSVNSGVLLAKQVAGGNVRPGSASVS
jgi:hypothetical protein